MVADIDKISDYGSFVCRQHISVSIQHFSQIVVIRNDMENLVNLTKNLNNFSINLANLVVSVCNKRTILIGLLYCIHHQRIANSQTTNEIHKFVLKILHLY